MVRKRSVIAGFLTGGIILALGLALIFFKEWAWSLFEIFYSMLGIQGNRTRLWEMFITTVGLGVLTIGFFILLGVYRNWQAGR